MKTGELPRFGQYARPLLRAPRFGTQVDHTILVNRLDNENGGIELKNQRLHHPDLVALNEIRKECLALVKGAGLDPLPVNVYVVPEETYLKLAARNGFIERYPHWSWGQEYFNLKLPRLYGKKEFLQVVVPNDPAHVYLPDTDPAYGKKVKMLMAHIDADLYKNNVYFRKYNSYRNVGEFASHAEIVRDRAMEIGETIGKKATPAFLQKLAGMAGTNPEQVKAYLDSRINPDGLGREAAAHLDAELKEVLDELGLERDTLKKYLKGAVSEDQLGREKADQLEASLDILSEKLGIRLFTLQSYITGDTNAKNMGTEAANRINGAIDALGRETGVSAERIRNFLIGKITPEEVGNETVEEFLDRAHSVRYLVNIAEGPKPLAKMTTPTWIRPQTDVLGYIIGKGRNLTSWQRDLLEIIRQETYAQLPAQKTRILAAGWGSFWNEKLNVRNPKLWDIRNVTREAQWSAGIYRNNPLKVNDYQLGYVIFKNIERDLREKYAGDPQRDRKVLQELLRIRATSYDVSLIRRFMTKKAAEELLLYNYAPDDRGRDGQEAGTKLYITDDDFEQIRERLIEMNEHAGQPVIRIVDGNYRGEGGLLLQHVYQYDLKRDYAEQTVMNLAQIWGKRVYLQTYETKDDGSQKPLLLSSDGRSIVSRNVLAEE